ncbi:MAG: Ldh family oxidoreductase [Bacteroidales bacterium]|nr:Ldh family oxidoreductase [Bacteroidales bacterium]
MYTYEYLKDFTQQFFIKMGCSDIDAAISTDVFLEAELRGFSSHGVIRIRDYFNLWKSGRVNVNPNIKIVHETPSTAVVDGDCGIGMVVGTKSMEIAMEKAEKVGTGWVATKNSNHYGIAGYYPSMALKKDMIGFSLTNANPLVAPTFSLSRMLGTNPIAVGFPTKNRLPFLADFATTPVANGKLSVAAKKGLKVPQGLIQDADGNPSVDPGIMKNGGTMLPLGGDYEHGSHKGYILSSMVDILSGVLSGANFGPFVPPFVGYLKPAEEKVGEGTGHFFGAMRIDAFQPAEEFKLKMDEWIDTIKKSKPTPDQDEILIPGELEHRNEQKLRKEGIPVIPAVVSEIKEIADYFGLDFEVRS